VLPELCIDGSWVEEGTDLAVTGEAEEGVKVFWSRSRKESRSLSKGELRWDGPIEDDDVWVLISELEF